jgi:hypothetical protein
MPLTSTVWAKSETNGPRAKQEAITIDAGFMGWIYLG